jgi:hypothetical protein
MKEKDSGEELMNYTNEEADLWRSDNSFLRPKWGIYRSNSDEDNLRDEYVYFNNFCLAKDEPLCN